MRFAGLKSLRDLQYNEMCGYFGSNLYFFMFKIWTISHPKHIIFSRQQLSILLTVIDSPGY